MRLKKLLAVVVCVFMAASLAACSGGSPAGGASSQADAEQSFALKLGHNLAEDHAVHIQLTSFAANVEEQTGGRVKIQLFPNGTLGSETDMLSQIQNGALDMAKVSASTMGNFSNLYNVYSVPYVFNDQAHYYSVMDGPITQGIFDSTEADGFIGLTWLDSGARSFYTSKPIRTPADLAGLKIRTMDSQMAIDMMNAMGGSSVVMGYADIYTALQQGVVDGAENNVTALRDHGEVAKYYSFDMHTNIPDIITISANVWNSMPEDLQTTLKACAVQATEEYKVAWKNFEDEVLANVTANYGVELIRDVDIPAFQTACQPIYDNLQANSPDIYAVIEEIRAVA